MDKQCCSQKTRVIKWKSQCLPWVTYVWVTSQEAPRSLRNNHAIDIALGRLVDGKSTFWFRAQRNQSCLDKRSPCWLAFIVLEGTMQAAGVETTSMVLYGAGPCTPKHWPMRQDVLSGAILAKLFVGATNHLDEIWGLLHGGEGFMSRAINIVKAHGLRGHGP